jgi:hypothetical protein
MVKGQAGGRRVLTSEQIEKRRMRNKKILHGLEETGKYLGKVAIDSGLAEKAVKIVSKIGRRKARALAGKEGKDAVKRMESDALAGLKKLRGNLEHKSWADKQGAPPPYSSNMPMPAPYPSSSTTPLTASAVPSATTATTAMTAMTNMGSMKSSRSAKGGDSSMKGGMVGPAGTHYFQGQGRGKKMPTVGSRRQVFGGYAVRTSGGLTKEKLMKNPAGRIVSRAKSAFGKEKGIKFLTSKGYVAEKGKFKLFRKSA